MANSLNSRSSKKLESQWLSSEPLQPVLSFHAYRGHSDSSELEDEYAQDLLLREDIFITCTGSCFIACRSIIDSHHPVEKAHKQ